MLVYIKSILTLTKQLLSSKILESAFLYYFYYEENGYSLCVFVCKFSESLLNWTQFVSAEWEQ